ncbi:hypothetical protein GGQ80_002833 [Sphingomonas jinjuensis]|uniref:Ice-binding protein C-terminal domain-containing protein n=1 Tax=Sphingomonas jinjuensis TaxID=535907 RepID=A0A840FGW0_9SPHN|nr:PEPxxWA-CTERM sorting domain-containing protein [Sphingomonas jinjuensis]MBB4154917.1 hypothetical protein [Sphingomonas jinjuensis]
MKTFTTAVAAAAMFAAVAPASAATINFTTGSLPTWTGGGVTVTVAGRTILSTGTTTVTAANSTVYDSTVQKWDQGLGVSNGWFDAAGTTEHTTDNRSGYDYIRLDFDKAVSLTGMTLNAFALPGNNGALDKDAWVSFSNTGSFADALANQKAYTSNAGADGVFPSFANTFSKTWVIGAALTPQERNDAFKLAGISFNVAAVPEPATWAMMLVGFGLVGGALRRRGIGKLASA